MRLIAFFLAATFVSGTVHPQAPVPATSAAGSDIGDRINHALKSCGLQCTVYIPPGNYSFGTTIRLELNPFGKYKLSGDPGAVVTYTGTGDAITTPVNNLQGSSQLLIEGFQLRGNPHATAGIHTMPTNRITIRNMVVTGFTGGNGILVEGTNSSNIYDNLISGNKNGIRLIPTLCGGQPLQCGGSVNGSPYAANAMHVTHNQITGNAQWAIYEDTPVIGHGLSEALNNLYMGNDFEENGGGIYLTRSRGTIIEANYFEGSPRQVVLGIPNAGAVTARTAQWCATTISRPRTELRTTLRLRMPIAPWLKAIASWWPRPVRKIALSIWLERAAPGFRRTRSIRRMPIVTTGPQEPPPRAMGPSSSASIKTKQQVPPLRFAPVGMTIHWDNRKRPREAR